MKGESREMIQRREKVGKVKRGIKKKEMKGYNC